MSQYFIIDEEILLSTYLKQDISQRTKSTIKYLIECLGDVTLTKSVIRGYEELFSCTGGRYDVRHETDTIKGLYDIYLKVPRLSFKGFYEIAFRYIKDLFLDYSLDSFLIKTIKVCGETDEAMELFLIYVEKKAKELQKKYERDASRLDEFMEIYHIDQYNEFFQFIPHLKSLVLRRHIPVEDVIDSLPSPELVKKDALHLKELAHYYRTYMGCGDPISYLMAESLALKQDLFSYGERPSYYISTCDKFVEATFTTQEFIDSVQNEKSKRLIRKK